jgi:hypothetical protein
MVASEMCVTIAFRLRWWVGPYLETAKAFCLLFGTEPDIERIAEFICKHGIVFEVKQ